MIAYSRLFGQNNLWDRGRRISYTNDNAAGFPEGTDSSKDYLPLLLIGGFALAVYLQGGKR